MIRIILGVFMVLHGLVHLLYLGQSQRFFELQPGMVWPDRAWVFTRFLEDGTVRWITAVALIIAAIGFVASGIGLFWQQVWWRPAIIVAAIFSSVIYLLFWDGDFQYLDNKGGIGILINLAILAALLIFQWPKFAF